MQFHSSCAHSDLTSHLVIIDVRSNRSPRPFILQQNFGAALRSAFFLGASGVITCRRNSSPLSAAVSKASAGAMEIMAVHACRSLPQTLADARQRGWCVIGAAAEPDAVSCYDYRPSKPTILVMGNEGYGVRPTVRRLCDAMLRIDSGPDAGSVYGMGGIGLGVGGGAKQAKHVVDSLNVSVATGILLHQLLKARSQGV